MIATKPFTELDLLKKQLAEETKEKYGLMKRITELLKEIDELKSQQAAIVR